MQLLVHVAACFTRRLTLWRPICFSLVFSSFGKRGKRCCIFNTAWICLRCECTITIAQMHFGLSIFSFAFFVLTFSLEWMNKWIKNKHKDAVSGSMLSFLWTSPRHHRHLCCCTVCGQHVLVSAISDTWDDCWKAHAHRFWSGNQVSASWLSD